ncbi:MAG: chemotaxis protein chel [Alphaproteobacteria bacterium HGW-Alphaproteobacteria-6]|nr:MAG: chemotaxis protein chel [Alphaproteobacteria bacterium HGW-Alphaproteobacteria-6]
MTDLNGIQPQGTGTARSGLRPATPAAADRDAPLRAAAQALEAQFLAEMLKSAGLGEARESFGGGVGEEQFASFLRAEQAGAMAQGGGIGLAESIFQAMKARVGNDG